MPKSVKLGDRFDKHLFTKHPTNDEVFKCLNACVDYLNLMKVSEYAKLRGISPQAVYQNYKTVKILDITFVADNE